MAKPPLVTIRILKIDWSPFRTAVAELRRRMNRAIPHLYDQARELLFGSQLIYKAHCRTEPGSTKLTRNVTLTVQPTKLLLGLLAALRASDRYGFL